MSLVPLIGYLEELLASQESSDRRVSFSGRSG